MTLKQKFLKLVYPLFMALSRHKSSIRKNERNIAPPFSFYSLSALLINNQPFSFENLKGKKVMIVNTASDCGYTPQYRALQQLYEANQDHLVVIGFPANDFKEQEKADDATIANFCSIHFGVSFPLFKKSTVVKGAQQHPVFHWLSDKNKNGWNNKQPEWNFCKYLVDENGKLMFYFPPAIGPLDDVVQQAVIA